MSCEKFETQAQNKRYLGDVVDSLIKEAQDETDTFEDVPFDFRHHKVKTKPTFPVQWRMTEGRKRQLQLQREERLVADDERKRERLLVDGMALLERNARAVGAREAQERDKAEALRVEAGRTVRAGRLPARAR